MIDKESALERMCATFGDDILQLFSQLNSPKRRYVGIGSERLALAYNEGHVPRSAEDCLSAIKQALCRATRTVAIPNGWEEENVLCSVVIALVGAASMDGEERDAYIVKAKSDLQQLRVNYRDEYLELLARIGVAEVV
ncbi:hypothetical protein BURKHO8Y_240221 [Burkholderia sp. 8Y]|uniref:hypothetical protein n=1 Tax=Burkholderia sp. 8Y TaxID=2653133 RepID=UPI0012F1A7F5|nr:hypothetical protein [Burkholderia sp. 8Y]VXC59929.1 hypothetical protein BURKHO8Y_240221 [Burkholderia sp. 8Y]